MVRQDPIDSSHSCRCSYNTVQSDLANLDKRDFSAGSIDDEMVQYILIRIYQERILSGESNRHHWRRKLLNIKKGRFIQSTFP